MSSVAPPEVGVPVPNAAADAEAAEAKGVVAGMFGRGLIFVVVWSLQILVTTVASPILTHLIAPAAFGRIASAIALHQVLVVIGVVGLDQAVTLLFTQEDADAARGLLAASIAVACVVTLVIGLSGPLWAGPLGFAGFSGIVVPAVAWTAPAGACQSLLALLRAQDRLAMFSVVSLISAVGGQALGIILILTVSRRAAVYGWAGVVTQCVAAAIGIAACRPRLSGLRHTARIRRAIALGLPLSVGALAVFVLNSGDRLVVQAQLGAAAVGRYQVAYTVGSLGILLLTYLNQSWEPAIYGVRNEATRWKVAAEVRDRSLRMILPLILALVVGAPIALHIVAPASFTPGRLVTVVAWVAMAAVPASIIASGQRVLISLRRSRPVAVAAIVAAVINIGLNVVLVPVFGITGSAAATLVAFATQVAVLAYACRPVTSILPRSGRVGLEVAVTAVLAVGSTFLADRGWAQVVRWSTCTGCALWVLWHLRDVRRDRPGTATDDAIPQPFIRPPT